MVIEWEVGVDSQKVADHVTIVRWNLDAITQQDAEEAEKLWMEQGEERAQVDVQCTEDKVE
jgi:hypothetical protein